MSGGGTVSREVALGVIVASQCTVSYKELDGELVTKITSPNGVEHHGIVLPPVLSRHCAVGLARKLGIPPHHFYHPLEVEGFAPEDIQ